MNPLLFWIKAQPLTGGLGAHAWKAVSQSSALAPSSGDDAVVSRAETTYSWAFDHLRSAASRLASGVYWDVCYWATSSSALTPVINRMHDAPILRPSSKAVCEGIKRYPTRKVDGRVVARRLTKGGRNQERAQSALLQSQQLLQQQDYAQYQIKPNLVRRNSKEWVPEYKKERIDKINYNNVFGGLSSSSNNEIPTLPSPSEDHTRLRSNSSASESSKFSSLVPDSPVSSSTAATPETVASMPLSPKSVLSHKATAIEGVSPHDVICGRGGKANTHCGNVSFREEAKKLREWYESSSKSEKFTISSYLVDVVREKGGRFLRRDSGSKGGWVEADAGRCGRRRPRHCGRGEGPVGSDCFVVD